jgi:hypothetical protein
MFFPHMEQARTVLGHYHGPAVLILDGLSAHHTEAFNTEAKDRNIYPIFLVPYSSDQCQPIDLITYSVMKRFMSSGPIRFLPSDQSHKIVKALRVWHQAQALTASPPRSLQWGCSPSCGETILLICGWIANVRREPGLAMGKIPRRWMLVKEETGGADSRHSKLIPLLSRDRKLSSPAYFRLKFCPYTRNKYC